ncbi:MAG: glyoxalase-like domain protein [Alkalinema sp. CACIAM 70d]|nr:MAG: glyoxalase-like domain protein [Alkalinema sp. CACIAM 70d]
MVLSSIAIAVSSPVLASIWSAMGDGIFSTQGIMIMLLAAYAGAMWLFLTSAPKVYTVMVSDLDVARQFYEGLLNLRTAEIPLHYYYNYEQSLGTAGINPMYLAGTPGSVTARGAGNDGLWYQLRKNVQVHVISGASMGENSRHRHICFDRECLEQILLRVQALGLKYKIRQERPLNFLVKDFDSRVLELSEVSN